jgi:hypothetical protein
MRLTLALLLALAPAAYAGVVGFSSNLSGNSSDFEAAVAAQLGVIGDAHLTVDYEAHPPGALQSNFYPGLTVSFNTSATVTTALSAGGSLTGPTSTGEGLVTSGQHIYPGSAAFTMEVTFINPILGFGFYIIDYYNPGGANFGTLRAYTGANGTGTLIGSVDAAPYNFQNNHKYFLGILSMDSDIKSVTFSLPGTGGDGVYIDDLELAEGGVPEPSTILLSGTALALAIIARKR